MAPKKKSKPETAGAVWQVMGDNNAWTAFPEADSILIEQHYRTGVSAFITSALSFNKGYDSKYVFDFAKMSQTNTTSGKSRDISRIAPPDEFTWEWEDDTNTFVGYYDEDVALIEKLFRDTGLGKAVTTKAFSFNKGYGSVYELTFLAKDEKGTVVGEQANKDSGKKRNIRRSRKKQPWDAAVYGMTAAEAATKVAEVVKAAEAVAQLPPAPAAAAPASAAVAAAAPAAAPASQGSFLDPPVFWVNPKPMSKAKMGEYETFTVPPSSLEFISVAGKFVDAHPGATVVALERIQNTMLWGFYAMNRKAMIQRNGGNMSDANEHFLYFAESSVANVKTIMKLGFDVRVVPEGRAHGDGIYFFREALKAGKAIQNSDGTREMMIVRFAAGKVAKGSKGARRPPPLDPKKPTMALYDSCVDDTTNPQIYVLFLNQQAYPEYVVRYTAA